MPYAIALLMIAASILMAPAVQAEKRVALVIGNSAYEQTVRLKNPNNDAVDVSAALKKLGFEVVEGRDLDKRAMERVIRQFGVGLAGADLALLFYAGHGMQVNGQNYLVPTDAQLVSEGDIDFESIPLALVLRQMEREAKTSVVLLDACRDNPLARNLARTMGTRSSQIGQGLAEVKTGVGTLISFSTQPGNVALDGQGRNSPYAEALLKHIDAPGKDVSAVLNMVRGHVLKSTNGKQVPWEHTSLVGSVYFKPQSPIVTEPVEQPQRTDSAELAFWGSVKDSKSAAMLQTYLEHFPSGMFASLARLMIEQLNKEETARATLAQREEELKRAEQAKQTAEAKRSDELRKVEESQSAPMTCGWRKRKCARPKRR